MSFQDLQMKVVAVTLKMNKWFRLAAEAAEKLKAAQADVLLK